MYKYKKKLKNALFIRKNLILILKKKLMKIKIVQNIKIFLSKIILKQIKKNKEETCEAIYDKLFFLFVFMYGL